MISLPGGTKMFQFPPCPPSGLCVQPAVPGYCPGGFPHSGIPGSKLDDSSPRLIAAIHALHRLLTPRHPPYALSSLIHARRQSLIHVLIRLIYSAQLLRCQRLLRPPRRSPVNSRLASDESLAAAPERNSGAPAGYPSRKTQNDPAHRRAM
jgi:hypothetical protein